MSTEGRVGPVCRGDGRLVLLRAGFVEDRQQLRGVISQGLQVDHGVSPVPVVAIEDQVSVEIPVESFALVLKLTRSCIACLNRVTERFLVKKTFKERKTLNVCRP